MHHRVSVLIVAALLFLVGCPPPAPEPLEPAVLSVTVEAETTMLEAGTSASLSAVVETVDGASSEVTWSSSDLLVLTVDEGGVVTALQPGFVVVTATSVFDPAVFGRLQLTVYPADDGGDPAVLVGSWHTVFHADAGFFFRADLTMEIHDDQVVGLIYLIDEPVATVGTVHATVDKDVYYFSAHIETDDGVLAFTFWGLLSEDGLSGWFRDVEGSDGTFVMVRKDPA